MTPEASLSIAFFPPSFSHFALTVYISHSKAIAQSGLSFLFIFSVFSVEFSWNFEVINIIFKIFFCLKSSNFNEIRFELV